MKPSEAEEYMGLESGAYDKRQLEQRFRKLSIKLHPDKNVGAEDSTEQFQRLGTAFDTLQRHLRGDGTVRDSDDDASWSDDEDDFIDQHLASRRAGVATLGQVSNFGRALAVLLNEGIKL